MTSDQPVTSDSPATSDQPAGDVEAAGAGLSDHEFVARVAGQTANDLKAADVFEREADEASTDASVAEVTGDDLQA